MKNIFFGVFSSPKDGFEVFTCSLEKMKIYLIQVNNQSLLDYCHPNWNLQKAKKYYLKFQIFLSKNKIKMYIFRFIYLDFNFTFVFSISLCFHFLFCYLKYFCSSQILNNKEIPVYHINIFYNSQYLYTACMNVQVF